MLIDESTLIRVIGRAGMKDFLWKREIGIMKEGIIIEHVHYLIVTEKRREETDKLEYPKYSAGSSTTAMGTLILEYDIILEILASLSCAGKLNLSAVAAAAAAIENEKKERVRCQ